MKGIVVEVNETNAVMLSDKGDFYNVPNKDYSVGQRISYVKNIVPKIVSVILIVLVVSGIGYGGYRYYKNPVSYVNIDINPQLRIELNAFEKVVEVSPLNYDAQELIDAVGKPNSDIKLCIQAYLDKAEELDFINSENKEVKIDVSSKDQERFKYISDVLSSLEQDNSDIELRINSGNDVSDEQEEDDKASEDDEENKEDDKSSKDDEDKDDDSKSSKDDKDKDDDSKSSKDDEDKDDDSKSSKSEDKDKDKDSKSSKNDDEDDDGESSKNDKKSDDKDEDSDKNTVKPKKSEKTDKKSDKKEKDED